MKNNQKIGLGKGLSALLGEIKEDIEIDSFDLEEMSRKNQKDTSFTGDKIVTVAIENIVSSKFQPRIDFADDAITDLVNSIKEKGVLQPLLVRHTGEGDYELIAGERRYRAAVRAGLSFLPVIIKDFSDKETLEVALIENLQREDLNPLEEAVAYQRLAKEFSRTQEDIAKVIGKSRSYIANTLRLLNLPEEVQEMLKAGKLTAGHARNLVGVDNAVAVDMANKITEQGLNVRETETLAGKSKGKKPYKSKKDKFAGDYNYSSNSSKGASSDIQELERACEEVLRTSVNIKVSDSGKGSITLDFRSFEQLDDLIQVLTA